VEHPQANRQAELANKVILKAIKRKLTKKDRNWAEPLPEILWAYHRLETLQGETLPRTWNVMNLKFYYS
jgi:hypothetical protein